MTPKAPLRPSRIDRENVLRAVAVRLRHRRAHGLLQVGLFLGRASDAEVDALAGARRLCRPTTPAGDIFHMAVAERARREALDRDEGDDDAPEPTYRLAFVARYGDSPLEPIPDKENGS